MLALDSLVLDLIFEANSEIDPEALVEALGGEEVARNRKILDPDMQDPRFEMEVSPSIPFRRRGERRLMIIDDSVAPMRADPRTDPLVPVDLRPEKERLLAMCRTAPIRLGRIFALGSMADAVLVTKSARDLRAICLLPWALDPTIDVDGKRRAGQLSQKEFETKLLAFDKRLDELSEADILSDLGGATMVRDGDLIVVDVLESDGTWDVRKSLAMEDALAAVERFSIIPGAPGGGKPAAPAPQTAHPERGRGVARPQSKDARAAAKPAPGEPAPAEPAEKPAEKPAPAPAPAPAGPPLRASEIADRVVLVFPRERFDLDAASALGRRDYDAVITSADALPGEVRDRIHRDGAEFVAPVEFLSEVFIDGVPLSRPVFDERSRELGHGVRALDVHYPRFGPALLLTTPDGERFISSLRDEPERVLRVLAEG